MARHGWERMFLSLAKGDFFHYFNLIEGWLKTKDVTMRPGELAERIRVCMTGAHDWKRCTHSSTPPACANLTAQCRTPRLRNTVSEPCGYVSKRAMWFMCIKVWKELHRTLLPVTPREYGSGLVCPCYWGDAPGESKFGHLEGLSLVRPVPNASGATGWRMNTYIHKRAGSVEKNKAEIYVDNSVGSLWTVARAGETNPAYIRKVVICHASFNK